ncbi:MAG: LacI family DNA-binding transcriptional regulator [Thermotogota bacterium]|nr:LacI family DNA-binding transcriptional regulator [Thermotogota bacterium]
MKRKKYLTIRDIAEKSGFSINTVSRVLNEKDDVNENTKKKIKNIIEETGYVRNVAASGLRTMQTKIIGVVFYDNSNPFYAEVLKGIEEAARKFGYQIIFMNTNQNYEKEASAIKILQQRRVDGILVNPVQIENNDLQNLLKNDFPVVVMALHFEDLDIDEIYSDEFSGGYLATRHILERNRKKILLISTQLSKSAPKMLLNGYKKALNEFNIPFDKKYLYLTNSDMKSGYMAIQKLLQQGVEFDGVFCYNDLLAVGALRALKENNLIVPDDVTLVGYDDIDISSYTSPSISTIHVQKFEIGYYAFIMLMEKIQGKTNKAQKKKLEVKLIIRESSS